jgi:hypothetical protein
MGVVNSVIEFLTSPTGATILGSLFVFSEALGGIPQVKQNSVYQVVLSILSRFAPKKEA